MMPVKSRSALSSTFDGSTKEFHDRHLLSSDLTVHQPMIIKIPMSSIHYVGILVRTVTSRFYDNYEVLEISP